MGAGTGPTTDVILPAIQNVAAKYHLPIVPLYPAFLNQPQLYKDATHPTNDTGLKKIADTVYTTMKATMGSCSDGGMLPASGDGGGSTGMTVPGASEAGSGEAAVGDGSAPGIDPSVADGGGDEASTDSGGFLGRPDAPPFVGLCVWRRESLGGRVGGDGFARCSRGLRADHAAAPALITIREPTTEAMRDLQDGYDTHFSQQK